MGGVLLGIAIAAQVAWGEAKLVREVTLPTQSAGVSRGLRTPLSEFVGAHVPAGRPILYVTQGHGIPELFSYYQLSYALAPDHRVWWAADGPVTTVVDWWVDVSAGSARLVEVARARGSAYLVFAGRPPPPDLPVTGLWRQDATDAVVRIST
jgi:hypothetical protein